MIGILLAATVAATSPSKLPPPGPLTTPDAVADSYFGGLQNGNVESTYQRLFGLLLAQKPAEAQNLIAQTNIALKMVGKVTGWELMRERQLSPSFDERFYILKADTPLFYRLLLYKAGGNWTLYSVTFYDQFDRVGLPTT